MDLPAGQSAFLWGPRRSGKSYWLRQTYPTAPVVDLLKTDVFADFATRPSLLRERYTTTGAFVIIDEVQKVPALLDEVHWLIENQHCAFILTGSSARKLRRGHANLLAGRAWRREMTPLSVLEIDDFDLERALVSGLLPPHLLSPRPVEELRSYVADYLKEEIASEALSQNLPAFAAFLNTVALTTGELLNYTNVASEAGVSTKVVRQYFDILEDTLLGFRIQPWRKSKKRRLIETEKFYLFDVGVANYLARRTPTPGGSEFGKAFEHYILMELRAYQAYRAPDLPLSYWRTTNHQEVDFILGDMDVAIEVKGTKKARDADLRPLATLAEESRTRHRVVVSLETEPRRVNGIEILPWRQFIDRLWQGEFGL